MRSLLLLAALLAAPASAPRAEEVAPEVLVLAVDFVLEGRLESLRAAAQREGVGMAWHHVERMDPATVRAQARSAKLVLLDAPRGNDIGRIRELTGELLGAVRTPQLLVGAGGHQARGLPEAQAAAIATYYAHPLPANATGLWRYVAAELLGRDGVDVPAPVTLPPRAIVHPALPALFETDPARYRAWLRERDGRGEDVPAIALAVSASQLDGDQSALLEALVQGFESRGARVWPFYHPWSDPEGMRALLSVEGQTQVDAVVNLTHIMGVAERQAELAALDVPLLQGFAWREGSEAEWRADPEGLPMRTLPAFLAVPEQMGAQDPLVIAAHEHGRIRPIAAQVDLLVERALRMAALRRTPPAQTRLALMYWSYPPGERGVSASKLNVPRSLAHLLDALAAEGYRTATPDRASLEDALPALLDPWQGRVAPARFARDRPDRVLRLPLGDYRRWFDALPPSARQRVQARWGDPASDPMLVDGDAGPSFAIPAIDLGNVLLLPQPARGRGESLHDGKVPPGHAYLAAYLAVREAFGADALVHFGTHGSQEFLPGKERALAADDDALLALGGLPVVYPYISDNIAEALQAKRRGRAVTLTHQPPPFAPAGLHGELLALHELIHEWALLDDGPVRARTEAEIRREAVARNVHRDLGWEEDAIAADFAGFERALHDYLHALAADAQPLGLHAFGLAPEPAHRVATVMQMLGEGYYEALGIEEPEELFSQAHDTLEDTEPHRFLARYLLGGEDPMAIADAGLREQVLRGREWFEALAAGEEIPQLLRALRGRYIPTSTGGDPIRNPDILPTGRNLFGFDPSRLPSPRAWETGRELADALLEEHRAASGEYPTTLAMSLWSSEAMRHHGVLESQALALMGLAPEWDAGGRVTGLRVMEPAELGRPRVDVVFSLTGVYRDQFPQFMDHLARATFALAQREEPDNAIAANSRRLRERLAEAGINGERALALSAIRVFSSESGSYGTGLTDGTLDTEGWDEEGELAGIFLARMQSGFGHDRALRDLRLDGINLFAENLRAVQGAVLSRSSNLNGLLSTDHPFEYLGGLSLAVRHLSGRSPTLHVANLRDPQGGHMQAAAQMLAGELRSRYHHPGWLTAMQAEGYAGTLELLNVVNNSFGWQVMDSGMLRADQWQAFHDIYVRDSLGLELDAWFREHNPEALRRIVERMLETVRRDYWEPSEDTLRSLVEAQLELSEGRGAEGRLGEYIDRLAQGFGLDASGAATPVSGALLREVAPPAPLPIPSAPWLLLGLLALPFLLGAWRQSRRGRGFPSQRVVP